VISCRETSKEEGGQKGQGGAGEKKDGTVYKTSSWAGLWARHISAQSCVVFFFCCCQYVWSSLRAPAAATAVAAGARRGLDGLLFNFVCYGHVGQRPNPKHTS
jgi:hypothetical protein